MSQLWHFYGRLHPLLLHLPIGLFGGWIVLELLCASGKVPRAAVKVLARLTAATAALSAAAGWVLAHEDGYGGELLEKHEQLGIASAVLLVLAALLVSREPARGRITPYRVLLVASACGLVLAGHAGSQLTHGTDWLLAPFEEERSGEPVPAEPGPSEARPPAPRPADAAAVAPAAEPPASEPAASYASHVAPILEARCTQCHGESKHKGGLRLHTPEEIQKGAEDGPVLVAGDPASSRLVQRVTLPLEHEDHMPPEGKPQPTEHEVATLVAWVAAGASFDAPFELPAGAAEAGRGAASPEGAESSREPEEPRDTPGAQRGAWLEDAPRSAAAPSALAPASADSLAALAAELVHVEPLATGSPLVWIDVAAIASTVDDARLARFLPGPLLERVAELSLARSAITDASLPLLARCPNLARLDLSATRVTEVGLAALAGRPALAELVLADMRLRDGALETLLALPALETVVLWRSGLSAEALQRLASERPALRIVTGEGAELAALETEPELVFSGDRSDDGGPAQPQAGLEPAAPAPVNALCPVSGSAVKTGHTLLHEGRVIGFCCGDCPRAFAADPARYAAKLR